jgi:hypothetical protein
VISAIDAERVAEGRKEVTIDRPARQYPYLSIQAASPTIDAMCR